jgi:hypothetical protein
MLDVIKVEKIFDEKSKESITFHNTSNKNSNGKRLNNFLKKRSSKSGNDFGYK